MVHPPLQVTLTYVPKYSLQHVSTSIQIMCVCYSFFELNLSKFGEYENVKQNLDHQLNMPLVIIITLHCTIEKIQLHVFTPLSSLQDEQYFGAPQNAYLTLITHIKEYDNILNILNDA